MKHSPFSSGHHVPFLKLGSQKGMLQTVCSLGPSKIRCEDGIKCARTLVVETPVKGNAEDARRGWRANAKKDPE